MGLIAIGERLKFIRETYDVTQEELGEVFHVSKSSISHYEKNDWLIPMKHLIKMSDYLNLSIDYIFDLTRIKRYPNSRSDVDLKIIGERIKTICLDQNFTNVRLAKELNTSESNIRRYKAGKGLILTAFAVELSMKFHYSIDWIVGKADVKYLEEQKEENIATL